MSVLPRQLNYQRPSALPAGTKSTQIVINPNNGSTFSNTGEVIQFDLLQKGFIVPTSMTLSYTINVKSTGGAEDVEMLGVPAVAPFQRLETVHNGNVIESVNQYNSLYNMLIATKLSHTQKDSLAPALGYSNKVSVAVDHGRIIENSNTNGTDFSVAFPLGCLISNCENLFPAAYVGSTRIQLTLDDINNIFARQGGDAGVVNVASMTLSNLTLKYDVVEFPAEVDQMVLSTLADETGSIHVKSQTFQTSTQTLPANSSGQQSLIYNARLSSIKSLVAAFQGADNGTTYQKNGKFDAVDVTSKNGTYQFMLNGNYYPQRPLDTKNDFAGCFLELNSCWSQPHDVLSTSMSILQAEYEKDPADDTDFDTPAKHFVGVNVENMSGASGTLFSGISSQMSPINLNVNLNAGNSGAGSRQVDLYICHDAIISINVAMRDLIVKQ